MADSGKSDEMIRQELKPLKAIFKKWIGAVLKGLDAEEKANGELEQGSISELNEIEKQLIDELLRVIEAQGVDVSSIKSRINTVMMEPFVSLDPSANVDAKALHDLAVGYAAEVNQILQNPNLRSIVTYVNNEVTKLMQDQDMANLCLQFVQVSMTFGTNLTKLSNQHEDELKLMSLLRAILTKLFEFFD